LGPISAVFAGLLTKAQFPQRPIIRSFLRDPRFSRQGVRAASTQVDRASAQIMLKQYCFPPLAYARGSVSCRQSRDREGAAPLLPACKAGISSIPDGDTKLRAFRRLDLIRE
jgi:hypothetical protein